MKTTCCDWETLKLVSDTLHPQKGSFLDDDSLIAKTGDANAILRVETTLGAHKFYREGASLTERLMLEKGFHTLAVQGDRPDACQVCDYRNRRGNYLSAVEALVGLKFITVWMWPITGDFPLHCPRTPG